MGPRGAVSLGRSILFISQRICYRAHNKRNLKIPAATALPVQQQTVEERETMWLMGRELRRCFVYIRS